NSYEEMFRALKLADKRMEESSEPLLQILTGEKQASFNVSLAKYSNAALNASQNAAVQKILEANELAIVHGPPGTGKTTTLVQAIKELLHRGAKKILVTAPSNTAVDLLSEKISEQGIQVLRIGNPARITERLLSLPLDHKMSARLVSEGIQQLKKQ